MLVRQEFGDECVTHVDRLRQMLNQGVEECLSGAGCRSLDNAA
jgi:hypothetical protein